MSPIPKNLHPLRNLHPAPKSPCNSDLYIQTQSLHPGPEDSIQPQNPSFKPQNPIYTKTTIHSTKPQTNPTFLSIPEPPLDCRSFMQLPDLPVAPQVSIQLPTIHHLDSIISIELTNSPAFSLSSPKGGSQLSCPSPHCCSHTQPSHAQTFSSPPVYV